MIICPSKFLSSLWLHIPKYKVLTWYLHCSIFSILHLNTLCSDLVLELKSQALCMVDHYCFGNWVKIPSEKLKNLSPNSRAVVSTALRALKLALHLQAKAKYNQNCMVGKGGSGLTASIFFNHEWNHRDLQICFLPLWLKPFLLPQNWVVTRQVLSDGSPAMKFSFMVSEAASEPVQQPPRSCLCICLGSPGRAEQGRAALHTTCV